MTCGCSGLLHARQKSYEHGENAARLLALQIRQSAAFRMITEVQTNSGPTTVGPQDINAELSNFALVYIFQSEGDAYLIDD